MYSGTELNSKVIYRTTRTSRLTSTAMVVACGLSGCSL